MCKQTQVLRGFAPPSTLLVYTHGRSERSCTVQPPQPPQQEESKSLQSKQTWQPGTLQSLHHPVKSYTELQWC